MASRPEEMEREYNARASIPDHPRIFARWAEQGESVRRRLRGVTDVPFGDDPGEKLDFFPGRHRGAAPLLVFIHGGYWRSLDKFDFSWIARPFVDAGVAVALPNYGLAPRLSVEDIVRQQLGALAWLYRHADELGFDPRRIVVSGHSAGGHLTAMMMAALWPVVDPELPPDLVKAGIALSGLFDLEPLAPLPFINGDLRLDAATARKLSPVHLPPATGAPLVTGVGGLESAEFKRQTRLIRSAWSANARDHFDVAGANHLTVCDDFGDPASSLFRAALALVRSI